MNTQYFSRAERRRLRDAILYLDSQLQAENARVKLDPSYAQAEQNILRALFSALFDTPVIDRIAKGDIRSAVGTAIYFGMRLNFLLHGPAAAAIPKEISE